ncbi:hypothetical protein QBD01_002382 [Ochrobactrum sp. 19YEA23]|uniref:hypothetical protein n=1 Tax=Ochrobactrum sp. 19YEA23 TaxID=3039854 RepID=UPI0024797322|nr:hypothetical protein [Ochrobactrum sp. 19YEA23]
MKKMAQIIADIDYVVQANKEFAVQFMSPNRPFWTTTLFLLASLQRIEANAAGFIAMVECRNYTIMSAILRMQIDTAMRVNGLLLMSNHEDGIRRILDGEKFNKLRCRSGKKLLDGYLVEKLSESHPWVKLVYERTSGMVHLSGTHIHHLFDYAGTSEADGNARIDLIIGAINPTIPDELHEEAAEAFRHVTAIASTLVITLLNHHPVELNEAPPEAS